ncbi:hypothetical protein PHYBOEH_011759 [Phytophthora boehmeriae]|uniref:M96 mating-specific protein family n=1 Tax=Phytophthora boehmeriae TaxID=109152 RepID=A0A8T1VI09_9STRA|nr:hypothetical protein PHYBOEH_011759 [Phytophthora boehmeriae]
MSSIHSFDDDLFLDESSVLALLSDLDSSYDAAVTPTVSIDASPSPVDTLAAWSDSTSASDEPTKGKKKSWRQRRKEELLTLREVVKHLEAELQRRKAAAGVQSTLPSSGRPVAQVSVHAAHKTKTALMWERIAGRQSLLRQKSDEENAKLRDALKQQIQQAKMLQRAVKRKLREHLTSSSMGFLRPYQLDTRGLSPPLNNQAVFDMLMAGMDDVHADLDNFFESVRMHELPCPGRRNDTAVSRAKGVFVEFLDSYALPFGLRETEKVIWSPEPSTGSNTIFLQVRRHEKLLVLLLTSTNSAMCL